MKNKLLSNIIDCHCHIADIGLKDFNFELLEENGIKTLLMAGVDPLDWSRQEDICNKYQNLQLFKSFGIHPYFINSSTSEELLIAWESLIQKNNFLAIGETGLDLRKEFKNSEKVQLDYFKKHIELANNKNKALILHLVRCHHQSLKILKSNQPKRGFIYHSFNAPKDITREYLKFDCYFSIGGAITFESHNIIESLNIIPLDRILIESDSPDQAPKDWPDKLNSPLSILRIAEIIAKHKNISTNILWEQVKQNFLRLFCNELCD